MFSNTKLNSMEKETLRDMKIEAKCNGIMVCDNGQTTVAFKPMGNTVRFATSVASNDEQKFRRKVGQYRALDRLMYCDNYVVLATEDFNAFMDNMNMDGFFFI